MGAAVVRLRKSKVKRQAASDMVDERKSSNCPFIQVCELGWNMVRFNVGCGTEQKCSASEESNRKGGMSNKREGALTCCILLLPFLTLRWLRVSDKVLSSGVGRSERPCGEPHTKSSFRLSLAACAHTHVCPLTLCVWGGVGLGPSPADAGLLEEDIRRDAEWSWEEWRCGSLGSKACRRCWPTSARLSPLYRFLLLRAAAEAPSRRERELLSPASPASILARLA